MLELRFCDIRGILSLKEITVKRKNNGSALLEMGAAPRPETLAYSATQPSLLAPPWPPPGSPNHHLRGQAIQFVNKDFGNFTESRWRVEQTHENLK